MRLKIKLFILSAFLITALPLLAQGRPEVAAPIKVGGTFSGEEASAGATAAAAKTTAAFNMEDELSSLREAISKKQYNNVISRINSLVAEGKNTPRFNLLLAQAYEGTAQWDNAVYHASEVIGMSPSDSRGFTIRGGAYYKKGELDKASIDIEKSLKINPNSNKAKLIKKLIDDAKAGAPTTVSARPQPTAQPPATPGAKVAADTAAAEKTKRLETIRWWIIYFIAVLAVICAFVYFRYPAKSGSSPSGAKKIDIKEQYNFTRQIGEGGMGKVYEAYDKVLKRRVAIKRVRPELVRSNYVREQFLSEARMVALLRHPNIVEIYTVIESDNSLYLVFEYVDGQTLETRLDIDGFIPFSECKVLFESVCRGLHYAHAQDIIHCDLKPGNIMITDGSNAKVMDFGVAKKVVEGDNGARTVAGTPAYMAPEQQKGFMKKQSDVYSLGVCLYESLVGQVPWSVAGFDIANKRVVPPSKIVPFIPVEVDALLSDALKEDPTQRIQSIDEFWTRLSKIEPLAEQPRPKHI
ncbi:tRNA A-37 threonylcarbamoyl transferase component Bud32 [Elusimicrobium simillimum]|uniref:serine/threonine-protein kinase n=1 Tax=Elusimicrobium simillimum TaxID=3143438 RepID=UPI003C6FDB23